MKFSSFVLGHPENYFVFLLSESFSIFNVICVFRNIDGSKERKERTSRKNLGLMLSRLPKFRHVTNDQQKTAVCVRVV